jgi:signal transduction histidine kinase
VKTNDLRHIRFPNGISQRGAIALVNLAALAIFVAVELGFSYFNFPTPRAMLLVATVAVLFRCGELALSRGQNAPPGNRERSRARLSICAGILLPFALAAATGQFHTHYFGLLMLPVLEAALYFSLVTTLIVAAVSSSSACLWVGYAAHFTPPFQLGELIETATLVLLLFTVGTLVWALLDLLGKREAELRERVKDLEITRGRLVQEEKLAAIGRLASAVAHEIRNPVAIISSAMEAASSARLSAEERADMSNIARTEARRLEKLTTDFLSYAQPGDLPRSEVDVHTLVGYIASIAKAQALGKNVSIEMNMEDGFLIRGNEDQLQQALLNLIRNAIDASPEGGQISVACEPQGELVRIAVENQGAPIPAQASAKIFEPFFTTKSGGTGLGLSIARKIAETHGGILTLEENVEGHVRFELLLPSHSEARVTVG